MLKPSHSFVLIVAASMTIGLGAASTAQGPPAAFAVAGDATVVYDCVAHALVVHGVPKVTSGEVVDRTAAMSAFYRQAASHQDVPVDSARMKAFIRRALSLGRQPVRTTPYGFRVTESTHAGVLLYKYARMSGGGEGASHDLSVLLYDGKRSYTTLIPAVQTQGSDMQIGSGLLGDNVPALPIFCASFCGVTIVDGVQATTPGRYPARVLFTEGSPGPLEYSPANVQIGAIAGRPVITKITVLDGNRVRATVVLSGESVLNGVALPSRIVETRFDPMRGDQAYWQGVYTLASSMPSSLNPSQFKYTSYLSPRSVITAQYKGRTVIVSGYRSNVSLADQLEAAYIQDESLARSSAPKRNLSGLYILLGILILSTAAVIRMMAKRATAQR